MLLAALVWQHERAAASLRRSKEQYRSVVEHQTDLICRFLADGTFTFVNAAYCRYVQRSAEELMSQTFWQLVPAYHRTRRLKASLEKRQSKYPQLNYASRINIVPGSRGLLLVFAPPSQ